MARSTGAKIEIRRLAMWQVVVAIATVVLTGIGELHATPGTAALLPKSLPNDPPRMQLPIDARLESALYRAEQQARATLSVQTLRALPDGDELEVSERAKLEMLANELARHGVTLALDGRVFVAIYGQVDGPSIDPNLLQSINAELAGRWRHVTEAWVPIDQLTWLSTRIPVDFFIERVQPVHHDHHSQGPGLVNSAGYIAGGADGNGRTIAVIDSGYEDLDDSQSQGHAPTGSQVTTLTCSVLGCVANGGEAFVGDNSHGTGCAESAFAHAPGANYRLYRISSLTQVATAVQDAIDQGAHIITHSLSHYNKGWNDNSGTANSIANMAADAGLLFFTSAGNRARQHWQGMMNPAASGWHRFSGGDQTIAIAFPPESGGSFYLQWNTAGGTYNYDLYLYDETLTEILRSSDNSGNQYEWFHYANETDETQTVHLAVYRYSGGNTELELFMHDYGGAGNFQHQVAESSTTSPSNSTHPNVISVAAVHRLNYDSESGTGNIIASYSSRGPTNNGATRPDISAPTSIATVCCGGMFGGTSAATPNLAGAAAALWSAHPDYHASAIRWLLFRKARLMRDWGTPGKDNVYGWGGGYLYDFAPGTEWLSRGYGNTSNLPTGPYHSLTAAYANAIQNGRIVVVPDGIYPETFMSGSRRVLITSIGESMLGQP